MSKKKVAMQLPKIADVRSLEERYALNVLSA